jgi:hypothetical protein
MSAGGAAGWSSCEPPAVRMMSTASSTRSLRLSSGWGSCYSSLPGGTSMSAGGAAGCSSCEPPAVRMMSTASSTRSLRLSSVARSSRRLAGVSSSSIPVILLARLGLCAHSLS